MRNTKTNLLATVGKVIKKYGKNWCTMGQNRMLELLEEYHDTSIKRRALGYHLADLRTAGMIKTIKRTHRKSDGTICFRTSATCITPHGYYELWKLGCEWAKKMYDRLIKRYFPKPVRKIEPAEKYDEKEHIRRLELGKEIFKTEAYRKAFGLD